MYISFANKVADQMRGKGGGATNSGNDVLMIRQMSFAVLATVDLVAVEIDIVRETHGGG